MKTIFIAYNHRDKVIARFIYHNLSRENWADVKVFMDEFSIQPGEDIKQKCLAKAKIADLGIVILSEYTQKSEYVPQEVGILLSRDIPKIYVALHESWEIPPGYEKTIKSLPLYEEKDPSKGIKNLTGLIRSILKPQEIGATEMIDKARKLRDQGKFEESLEYAERAIRINPNYDLAYVHKIENLRRIRRYNEAMRAADEALAIFPNHAWLLYHKGFLLYSMRRYMEAIDVFNAVLDLTDGLDQGALYYKGRCLEQLGNLQQAIEVFEKCCKINPTSARGRDALQMKGTLKTKIKEVT